MTLPSKPTILRWVQAPDRLRVFVNDHAFGRADRDDDGWTAETFRGDSQAPGTFEESVEFLRSCARRATATREVPVWQTEVWEQERSA